MSIPAIPPSATYKGSSQYFNKHSVPKPSASGAAISHKLTSTEESRCRLPRFSRAHPAPVKDLPPSKQKHHEESFDAEENENELAFLGGSKENKGPAPMNTKAAAKYVVGVSTTAKKAKIKSAVPEHFEQEMDKHGLLDKIVHIQQLNNYFENELGAVAKKVEGGSPTGAQQQVSAQNSPNAAAAAGAVAEKGYAFPFQKRARSNSPPKNSALLFVPRSGEKSPGPTDPRRKPVVARTNFVIGKAVRQLKFSPKAQVVDQFLKSLESEDDLCCGLSTGPTDEIKGGGAIAEPQDEGGDGWMYQRINNGAGLDSDFVKEGEENVAVGEEEEGVSFLQMLNQAKFDK